MGISLDVLLFPAFDDLPGVPSEVEPWLARYDVTDRVVIPGVSTPVRYGDGIGVVPTGIGKTAAASTVTAILASDRVDVADCLFVSTGIAGGNPAAVTLGSVVLSTTIVDWDDKLRHDPTGDDPPIAPNPYTGQQGVVRLDSDRISRSRAVAQSVDLRDDPALSSLRDRGDHAVDQTPTVEAGPNVCGDELWHGREVAATVEWYLHERGIASPMVTEMEDLATARALDRFDHLDRYVSVRGVANFDRPPAGTSSDSPDDAVQAGAPVALANGVAVAATIVDDHLAS